MNPLLATIESEAVSSAYGKKERAAMRRAAGAAPSFSIWARGGVVILVDAEGRPPERSTWRQDVLMLAAILAGAGAFFGPFRLPDRRFRLTLAALAAVLLLARSTRLILEKIRYHANLRYDEDVGLLKGGVVRYVANDFSKVVNDNNGLGWLAEGIRGQENGLRDFNARFNPALEDAQDLVAVILAQRALTHEQARLQAVALSRSITRMHAIVADIVSLAHKAEPVEPGSRAKAHHAYRLWQAFLDDYRGIAEKISRQADGRIALWASGPLNPPASLPSFR